MERVHQLVAAGNIDAETEHFWDDYWPHIASAKVPLATKVAAYNALKHRGFVDINTVFYSSELYEMTRADRTFVAALDMNKDMAFQYHVFIMLIDDDVVALARYMQEIYENPALSATDMPIFRRNTFQHIVANSNSQRCVRFLFQDKAFREVAMSRRMSPLTQQIAEEFVQPTDRLNRESLLSYGQSVKLIGLCVPDEELVEAWLDAYQYDDGDRIILSVPLARKLHMLATPEQSQEIKTNMLREIEQKGTYDGCFELVWLFGLLGPFDPAVQACFLKHNVTLFPAFTFAMIVAMCDGYLELARGITESQKRFFDCAMRLPMDLQALVALRLWGDASAVIRGEKFDRALLAVI